MIPETLVAPSAGSLCVAFGAICIAFFQAYIFFKRPGFMLSFWSGLLSAASALYALAVFFQYNTGPVPANRLAEMAQYTSFLLIVHSLYGFTFAYFSMPRRWYHVWFGAFHALLCVLLWSTDLFVSHRFVERQFAWLSRPYVEPDLNPLGVAVLLYVAVACGNALRIWLLRRKTTSLPTGAFIAGFTFWLILGLNDVAGTLGAPVPLFMMEYGFLGFSLSVFLLAVKSYLDLLDTLAAREETLFGQKERLDVTLRSIGEGFVATDAEGRVTLMNRVAENLCGLNQADAEGRSVHEVLHLFDLPGAEKGGREPDPEKPGREGAGRTSSVLVSRYGQERTVYLTRTPIRDRKGGLLGEVFLFRDISDWEKARQALKESEEKYRTILDSIQEGYYEVDLAGNITFLNRSGHDMCGYEPDEMIGMNNRDYTTPETADNIYRVYNQVFQSGRPQKITRYDIIRKDGLLRTLEASASLMRDGEGRPTGFRGVLRDVTEEIQAAREKERLEEKLRQAQKWEALGTLAGGVAHDFNNLLMGMQGNVSLLLHDRREGVSQEQRIQTLEQYIRDAAGLTRQLLGFARGGKYEVRTTDINQVVEKTVRMFGRTKKELTLETDLASRRVADVDRGQIEQVLLNLFVNAWQAMPQGGRIIVETRDANFLAEQVKPFETRPGAYVTISVRDQGVGMDEETRKRVFDPFFTTKEKYRGTGLGLASAYGIIKNHGGFITVESRPGQGSCFSVNLPASDGAPVQEARTEIAPAYGQGTLLLVDDEHVVLETGREILEMLGYTVLTAQGGRRALELYQEYGSSIELIILDMIMPDLSGMDVFEQIRVLDPRAKILLSSGYSLNDQAARIMEKGCNGFLQKPFSIEELSHKIREILAAP